MRPAPCRVFWGSHGCSLPRGHRAPEHQCGLDGDEDDGLCSRIDWDPVERVWVQRFSTAAEGEDWDTDLFPVGAFGEDLPADREVPFERVNALAHRWQDEGRMAVFEGGRWVKRVRP